MPVTRGQRQLPRAARGRDRAGLPGSERDLRAFRRCILGRLLTGRLAGYYEEHPIVLLNVNEDVRETIGLALRYRHVLALTLGDGRPRPARR